MARDIPDEIAALAAEVRQVTDTATGIDERLRLAPTYPGLLGLVMVANVATIAAVGGIAVAVAFRLH